jgi:acetyltransferase-like isoleucine patch superfamily enzyme
MIILKIIYHLNTVLKIFLFKIIFGKRVAIGRGTSFRKGFSLIVDTAHGRINIGKNCFFNNYCSVVAREAIVIGNNTIFGENVKIYDHNHSYKENNLPIKSQGYTVKPVCIGCNCWIGSNVVILKGVTIGENSIIGAGCIVHKDIPANTIAMNTNELLLKQCYL